MADNNLFREGEHQNLNACVGTNGGPYDFSSYGEGFFYAAFYNIEAIIDGKWTLDLLVYPICFNFRHGIELYIKHFIVLSGWFFDESAAAFKTTHRLIDNWNLLSSFLERFLQALSTKRILSLLMIILKILSLLIHLGRHLGIQRILIRIFIYLESQLLMLLFYMKK